ncbi:MAG: fatty acid desaturase CarF family protein [Verrucomicrobiota bacterium]
MNFTDTHPSSKAIPPRSFRQAHHWRSPIFARSLIILSIFLGALMAAEQSNPWLYALGVPLQLLALILTADLLGGFIHWAEDTYGDPTWPIIGPLVFRPNIEHHLHPRQFTKVSFLRRNGPVLLLTTLILLGLAAAGLLSWQGIAFGIFASLGGEVHAWAHRTKKENGRVITFLQEVGLIQSGQHHMVHHTDPKEVCYCPLTNYVNPIVDSFGLWERLEAFIFWSTGITPREDPSVQPERIERMLS